MAGPIGDSAEPATTPHKMGISWTASGRAGIVGRHPAVKVVPEYDDDDDGGGSTNTDVGIGNCSFNVIK